MKRDFLDYVEDIVNAMRSASTFIEGMTFRQFQRDQKTAFAAVRALEIWANYDPIRPLCEREWGAKGARMVPTPG